MSDSQKSKILSREAVAERCRELTAAGKRVVYTSGTFDILHPGHVEYLGAARALGDLLVVGVNSDSSVRALKGPLRPVMDERSRAELIAALPAVDLVFIFDEPNNQKNVELIRPAIYAKAGDYAKERLSSAGLVESYGGRVELVPFKSGFSSSKILDRVAARYGRVIAQGDELPPPERRPAAFIDRDGTLIEHVEYLSDPAKVKFFPGAVEAVARIAKAGYRIVIVTNQPGIGLGYFSREEFYAVSRETLKHLSKAGALVDKIYFCPHSLSEQCSCRKPNTGLLTRAVDELNVDLASSFVIGDMTSDLMLARNAGCRSVLVRTGRAGEDGLFDVAPDFTAGGMAEAAAILEQHFKQPAPQPASGKDECDNVDPRTLEALGALGAKLGHDLNNILGSIQGAVDLIELRSTKVPQGQAPFKRQLELIRTSIKKGNELTAKVRSFVRPGDLEMDQFDLRACVEGVCDLFADSGLSIEIGGAAELPVKGNAFAITGVLAALCSNALDAMAALPDRTLVFFLEECTIKEGEVEELPAGRYARVSVIDHGKGMPPESRKRLFKPFFSTKVGVGEGLGLTMPMARETMRRHKGALRVDTRAELGTVVHLLFPR